MERWEAVGFYLLRAPRLPFSVINNLNSHAVGQSFDSYLKNLFKDPELQEAIFHASTVVYQELLKWMEKDELEMPARLRKTLYKYVLRMSSRATPYGHFAGVSTGKMADTTAIQLTKKPIPHYRLDNQLSAHLAKLLQKDSAIKSHLTYFPNSSLLDKGDHYLQYRANEKNGKRQYHWVRTEKNPLLKHVLDNFDECKDHTSLLKELSNLGLTSEQASHFIEELIAKQIITTNLEPTITGADFFQHLFNTCDRAGVSGTVPGIVQELNALMSDRTRLNPNTIQYTIRKMQDLSVNHFIQTDLQLGVHENQLSGSVATTIIKEIQELLPLNKEETPEHLRQFCQRFSQRYGDMEVPLLEALDTELGIGYGGLRAIYHDDLPLIKDLDILNRPKEQSSSNIFEKFVQQKLSSKFLPDLDIELQEEELKTLNAPTSSESKPYPLSFYAIGNLLTGQSADPEFKFNLKACGGVSAIPLMARFAYMDGDLEKQLVDCAEYENTFFANSILAEIIHLPDDHIGNILKRPVLREYEIPLLSPSSVSPSQQITLQDLLVSVRNGMVRLRSKRLGKWVLPRLSSAHNYRTGIVPYRFLCDLQNQHHTLNIRWELGSLETDTFLPRVTYKHLILSRRRWRLPSDALDGIRKKDERSIVQDLIEQYHLPDRVSLADGDNELLLDLSHPISIEILLERMQKGAIVLYEVLADEFQSPVHDMDGNVYANELILPIKTTRTASISENFPILDAGITRLFPPGSEWTYVKIYTGERQAERILSDYVKPLLDRLVENRWIDKWFFVRYHDPEPHIRLRCNQKADRNLQDCQQLFFMLTATLNEAIQANLIYKIQFDTYERELERYHPFAIEACESIFQTDSECTLSLLPFFKSEDGEQIRWLVAVKGVDDLLSVFFPEMSDRVAIIRHWSANFLSEFSFVSKLTYKLDLKYREYRPLLERFYQQGMLHDELIQDILAGRQQSLTGKAELIRRNLTDEPPERTAAILRQSVSGLAHMFLNRLFFANQRENEMVVYYLLQKQLTSQMKRQASQRYTLSGSMS